MRAECHSWGYSAHMGLVSQYATSGVLTERKSFRNQAEARTAVFGFIEARYKPHRRHSALGQVSPSTTKRSTPRRVNLQSKSVHRAGPTPLPPCGCYIRLGGERRVGN